MQSSSEVKLHPATMRDCWRIYRWRNLPEIVALGTSQRRVWPWEHWLWFWRAVKSDRCLMWIVQAKAVFVGAMGVNLAWQDCGVVRVSKIAPKMPATITIYLVPGWTGHGVGVQALRQACCEVRQRWPHVRIFAHIRCGNTRSERAFRKAGFAGTRPSTFCPPGHWEMVWCKTN